MPRAMRFDTASSLNTHRSPPVYDYAASDPDDHRRLLIRHRHYALFSTC